MVCAEIPQRHVGDRSLMKHAAQKEVEEAVTVWVVLKFILGVGRPWWLAWF